jgi:hypothetical protein
VPDHEAFPDESSKFLRINSLDMLSLRRLNPESEIRNPESPYTGFAGEKKCALITGIKGQESTYLA